MIYWLTGSELMCDYSAESVIMNAIPSERVLSPQPE